MKPLSSKFHGILDYFFSALLIASPWLFDFAIGTAAQVFPMVVGIIHLAVNLFTRYELGVYRLIEFPVNRNFDIFAGLILGAAPWMLSFNQYVYLPHLFMGLGMMVYGMLSAKAAFPAHRNTPVPGNRYKRTPAPTSHYQNN